MLNISFKRAFREQYPTHTIQTTEFRPQIQAVKFRPRHAEYAVRFAVSTVSGGIQHFKPGLSLYTEGRMSDCKIVFLCSM